MESLVHYQTLLVQHHHAALGDEECERLRANSLELLQQLEAQDLLRKQRYRDIGQYNVYHKSYHVFAKKPFRLLISCAHSIISSIKPVTSTAFCSLDIAARWQSNDYWKRVGGSAKRLNSLGVWHLHGGRDAVGKFG